MVTRFITVTLFSTPFFPYWLAWQDFWSIWAVFDRYDDLAHLVDWAKRKRLAGVRNHYKRLLIESEILLAHKQMRYKNLTLWARELYSIYRTLNPKPEHFPKGGAAKYRSRVQ